jgi:hypothetical protein
LQLIPSANSAVVGLLQDSESGLEEAKLRRLRSNGLILAEAESVFPYLAKCVEEDRYLAVEPAERRVDAVDPVVEAGELGVDAVELAVDPSLDRITAGRVGIGAPAPAPARAPALARAQARRCRVLLNIGVPAHV